MAGTTPINVKPELKDELLETAKTAAKQLNLPKLSLNDLVHMMHEEYKTKHFNS